mmetsp:Transcript_40985/g.102407  ORF Transcript_40985/g.102407 Transcript_40985/m.102407 type:complete len:220 (-) Transcript_40985:618-1277(-)
MALGRRTRLHRILRISPGCDQEGHDRDEPPVGPCVGGAVPSHRPQGHRQVIRSHRPHQQPVGQGRRRLHHGKGIRRRHAQRHADGVLEGDPGGDGQHGPRDLSRRDLRRLSPCLPRSSGERRQRPLPAHRLLLHTPIPHQEEPTAPHTHRQRTGGQRRPQRRGCGSRQRRQGPLPTHSSQQRPGDHGGGHAQRPGRDSDGPRQRAHQRLHRRPQRPCGR